MSPGPRGGWAWFGAWVLAGGLLIFSVLDLVGLGLFTMPLAIVALWFVLSRSRRWPEVIGLAPALGLVLLLFAWANRDYQTPCFPGIVLGSGGHSSCGGAPPFPFAVAGLTLVAGGVIAYAIIRRGSGSPSPANA